MLSAAFAVLATATAVLAKDGTPAKSGFTALCSATSSATTPTSSSTAHVQGKAFDRIAIIWLENTDYRMANADPNLKSIAEKGITLTNYFAVTHPSEPNYCASHGGDYFGMNDDNRHSVVKNVSTVVDLLEHRGISWSSYLEDMPSTGFEQDAFVNPKTRANDYVRKHNPAVLYKANTERRDRLENIKNLTLFYEDLAAGTLPQWMFITPNMTSDGHDSSVTVAGAWTSRFVMPLLNDKRFMQRTLVLITFDENASYTEQNRVMAILVGDAVPKELVNTTDSNFYTHYSELSTVQANWDLPTLGRWDVGANVFQMVANATCDQLRTLTDSELQGRYYNLSYDGVFHTRAKFPVYPKPNIDLVHSGRAVADVVKETWQNSKSPSYYEDVIQMNDGLNPPKLYDHV